MPDPLDQIRNNLRGPKPLEQPLKVAETLRLGAFTAPYPTAGQTGKSDPLHALRAQVKAGKKLTPAPGGPKLTDALKTLEGRLLTAIATVNGHGHPLQYAADVLAALKKITPA